MDPLTNYYTNFFPGEPNNDQINRFAGEACLATNYNNRKWNDAPCNLPFAYVCEIEANVK